MKSFYEEMNRS